VRRRVRAEMPAAGMRKGLPAPPAGLPADGVATVDRRAS
jgi:hypothetical protein